MKSEHAFALVALILGIVGGVLLCKGAIDVVSKIFEGGRHINFESPVLVGIGVIAIIASAMLWTGRYLAGGIINIILGIIAVFYGKDAEGLMILISGVLGIIAPKIKD
ncbi:hypothetical protein GWO13_06905 [Candidatus Bathyarchaeota archaeon]|nr:hypothetical protein [Candidatus Bathyarchaeota archaeon]